VVSVPDVSPVVASESVESVVPVPSDPSEPLSALPVSVSPVPELPVVSLPAESSVVEPESLCVDVSSAPLVRPAPESRLTLTP